MLARIFVRLGNKIMTRTRGSDKLAHVLDHEANYIISKPFQALVLVLVLALLSPHVNLPWLLLVRVPVCPPQPRLPLYSLVAASPVGKNPHN